MKLSTTELNQTCFTFMKWKQTGDNFQTRQHRGSNALKHVTKCRQDGNILHVILGYMSVAFFLCWKARTSPNTSSGASHNHRKDAVIPRFVVVRGEKQQEGTRTPIGTDPGADMDDTARPQRRNTKLSGGEGRERRTADQQSEGLPAGKACW